MNALTHPSTHEPASVTAGLNYLLPTTQQPYSYAYEPPAGTPWESGGYALCPTRIADARYAPQRPTLDREGYTLCDAPTAVADFLDEQAVQIHYYAESAALALAVTGAQQAYVFDHLVRQREPDREALSFGRRGANGLAAANGRIHSDYTEASGRQRLGLVLADPQAAARVQRYAIVNIWRSIKGPVLDTPLAVCDARTVSALDLVSSEVRYPRRTGEIYLCLHSPQHRWAYYSQMDRHEALVFKQYDSQLSGVARFTPHTAFDLPDIPPGTPLRQSIELRCLVVYEHQELA